MNYRKTFAEKLKKLFFNTHNVYSYEYMDIWKKFNETSLPEKKYFHSKLNMEGITMQIKSIEK